MVRAVVLLNVNEQSTAVAVAERLMDIKGIVDVHSVAGNFDLIAVLSVRENEELAELVSEQVRRIPGVERTQTLIAFRTYSRREVEGMLPMD